MPHRYAGGVNIVVVTMPRAPEDPSAPTAVWVAAVPRDEAVSAVKAEVPAICHVELSDWYLTQDQVAKLKLRPGQVMELGSATSGSDGDDS
jgi:hypothetical protein